MSYLIRLRHMRKSDDIKGFIFVFNSLSPCGCGCGTGTGAEDVPLKDIYREMIHLNVSPNIIRRMMGEMNEGTCSGRATRDETRPVGDAEARRGAPRRGVGHRQERSGSARLLTVYFVLE